MGMIVEVRQLINFAAYYIVNPVTSWNIYRIKIDYLCQWYNIYKFMYSLFCYCLSLSLSILYHKVHLISIGNIYKYGTPYLCIFTTLYIVVILLFVDI